MDTVSLRSVRAAEVRRMSETLPMALPHSGLFIAAAPTGPGDEYLPAPACVARRKCVFLRVSVRCCGVFWVTL